MEEDKIVSVTIGKEYLIIVHPTTSPEVSPIHRWHCEVGECFISELTFLASYAVHTVYRTFSISKSPPVDQISNLMKLHHQTNEKCLANFKCVRLLLQR